MKRFLKWTAAIAAAVAAGFVVKHVYTSVTAPIPEADQTVAESAVAAALEAAQGTPVEIGGVLYKDSNGRVAFAQVTDSADAASAAA